jgi:peroxiredoxin
MTRNSKHFSLFGNLRKALSCQMRLYTAILLLTLAIISCGPAPETSRKEEAKAPDFTLRDLDGDSFNLKAERGKMVLIIFTTTWCPSCRASIPTYRELYQAYGKRGMVMVNIDLQEPRERVSQFAKTNRLPYRVLLDEEGSVGVAYGIVGVPALVLINQDGETISSDTAVILEILGRVFPETGQSPS